MSASCCLRVAYDGELDPSLVGLLGLRKASQLYFGNESQSLPVSIKTHADSLAELESSTADFAVVTLDRLVEQTSRRQATKLRILGLLLAGDARGFAELQPTPSSAGCRILGSVHPEMAESRWEDLSCGLDINSAFDVGQKISPTKIEQELFSGRFGLMELNMHWEGLLGFRRGLIRSSHCSREFGLPHGFSHVLVVNCDFLRGNLQLMQTLREGLLRIYDAVLEQTQKMSEVLAEERIFSRRPNACFLQASFRILAPQLEGFLKCAGKLDWDDLCSYVNWFQARVAHRKPLDAGPFTAIQLQQLLCDAWG